MEEKGYTLKHPDDDHPLAWDAIYPPGTVWEGLSVPEEADCLAINLIREEVRGNWQTFKGEIKVLEGRPYLRLKDYVHWKQRHTQGDLDTETGVFIQSWNNGVDACADPPLVSKILVEKLEDWFDTTSYVTCKSAIDARTQQEQRKAQIARLRQRVIHQYETVEDHCGERRLEGVGCRKLLLTNQSFKAEVATWKDYICTVFEKESATLEATQRIRDTYFQGNQLLHSTVENSIQERRHVLQRMMEYYNDTLALFLDLPELGKIEIDILQDNSQQMALQKAQQFITRAKADALENVGCEKEAREIYREMLGG